MNQEEADIKKLGFIFSYATPVLQKYLLKKYDIDLGSVYTVPAKTPEIRIECADKKFILYMDVVDKGYNLDYSTVLQYCTNDEDIEKVKDELTLHCTFLINAVSSAFNYFKRTLKTQKDDKEYFLLFISLGIDENTNLYIDEDDEFKMGIIIKQL